jgi:hypothetical protein
LSDFLIFTAHPIAGLVAIAAGFSCRTDKVKGLWQVIDGLVCASLGLLPSFVGVYVYFTFGLVLARPLMTPLRQHGLSDRDAGTIGDMVTMLGLLSVLWLAIILVMTGWRRLRDRAVLAALLILPLVVLAVDKSMYDCTDPCTYAPRGTDECPVD